MNEQIYEEKKKVQLEYYNSTAEKYDSWHTETESAKIVDTWNFSNLQKFIGSKKAEKCLDIACGTGRLSAKLLTIAENVYGVDLSEEVLKIAKNKYPNINFTQGESVALPYQDNFFDLVVINGSLHHFFAMEQTFREVFRVLKPEGHFVILGEPNANYHKWHNPFFYSWLAVRLLIRALNIFVPQATVHQEMIEPDAEVFFPKKMRQSLKNVGFKIKEFYTYDYFPRLEAKWFLKIYKVYLNWERKFLSPILPDLGAAIQFLAVKQSKLEKK
ncbi:class I SAM-dependent methyltransferase [Candidatus Nomurabacteria bacterium]|nr:class I SAM-dependent methyltransferase [Candidatus Nomurabacteria bacterium]